MDLPVPLVLQAPLALLDRRANRVRKALLARRVIVDQQVPMVSGVLLALLVLQAPLALLVLQAPLALLDRRANRVRKALLARRVIVDQQVPMVSGVLLALLVLLALVALKDLPVLSDQRATRVLPDPRVGWDRKARLGRRVILENVVLLVRERITSGPSRWKE